MSPLELKRGTVFKYNGKEYTLIKVLDLSFVLAKDLKTEEVEKIPISDVEFTEDTEETKTTASKIDSEVIPDKHWEVAKRRLEVIKPLLKPDRTKKEVVEVARKNKINSATIYRWIKAYEESGGLYRL